MKKKVVNGLAVLTAVISVLSVGLTANAQPKTMKDGTVFDAEYYAQAYQDVVAVYGTNETSLYQHYTQFGRAENRAAVAPPSKSTFDAEYYAKSYPDVVAVLGTGENNLYQHYLQYGKNEGRKPVESTSATKAPESKETPKETQTETSKEAPKETPNETPTTVTMSYTEAKQIWDNFWKKDYLTYFDTTILSFFDTNGDFNLATEEVQFLYDWVRYGNDTDMSSNTVDNPISEQEMIAMATKLKNGQLPIPNTLRKLVYSSGTWFLL